MHSNLLKGHQNFTLRLLRVLSVSCQEIIAKIKTFPNSRWRNGIKLNTNVRGHFKHAFFSNMVQWVSCIAQEMHRGRRLPLHHFFMHAGESSWRCSEVKDSSEIIVRLLAMCCRRNLFSGISQNLMVSNPVHCVVFDSLG